MALISGILRVLTCSLFETFAGERRRGRLVSWVEKASLECIRQFLKIIKEERNHDLLLSVKNLQELGANPFPYIVPIIPRLLPVELVKGEHFVLANLFKSFLGNSSQACFAQAEVTEKVLFKFVRLDQLPLAKQDPQLALKRLRKRRRKQRRVDKPRLPAWD